MKLKRLPKEFLKKNYSQSTNVPDLYWHPIPWVRELFYRRLEAILKLMPADYSEQTVCDFGGGGGIFLPTLSEYFKKVVVLDIRTDEVEMIVKKYNLKNVEVIQGNALVNSLPDRYFDIVVAADVLEHFKDLKEPIKEISRLLKSQGLLLTSAPTENLFYRLGRLLLGFKKPRDHYHNAKEIEKSLRQESFNITKKIYLPFNLSFLSLFVALRAKNNF